MPKSSISPNETNAIRMQQRGNPKTPPSNPASAPTNPSAATSLTMVNAIVQSVIADLGPEIRARQIELELDLDAIPLKHQATTISTAIRGLIANSLLSAPQRGQISITLIDSADQWELEVADTSEPANPLPKPTHNHRLKLFDWSNSPHLQRADRAAFAIGGEIQFWNCPQGGVAFVLVIPKHRARMVA